MNDRSFVRSSRALATLSSFRKKVLMAGNWLGLVAPPAGDRDGALRTFHTLEDLVKTWLLGVIPVFAVACATSSPSSSGKQSETARAQSSAQSSFQGAADAQKNALAEQSKAEEADRQVTEAQKKLADAQAKARAQHARADQSQRDAQRLAQEAQQQGAQSQREAMQSQKSEAQTARQIQSGNQQSWMQSRTIEGQVSAASNDDLTVRSVSQGDVQLKLNDSTAITIDGQKGTATQIQPGADVRASYQVVDGKATAVRIDVTRPSR
jgi:colicin import membrane protein